MTLLALLGLAIALGIIIELARRLAEARAYEKALQDRIARILDHYDGRYPR